MGAVLTPSLGAFVLKWNFSCAHLLHTLRQMWLCADTTVSTVESDRRSHAVISAEEEMCDVPALINRCIVQV